MGFNFAIDVEPRESEYDLLPAGNYEAELIGAKYDKYTKNADSVYADVTGLFLTWKITENNEVGVNRRQWDKHAMIPAWRDDKKTPNFSLKNFAVAAGFVDADGNIDLPEDARDIESQGVTLGIKIKVGKDRRDGSDRNEIDDYLSLERLSKSAKAKAAPKVTSESAEGSGLFI